MQRRTVLHTIVAALGGIVGFSQQNAKARNATIYSTTLRSRGPGPSKEEIGSRACEAHEKALAAFPYELIETKGAEALSKWRDLKETGRRTPIILSGQTFDNLLEPFDAHYPGPQRTIEEILKAADALSFPADLASKKKADNEQALATLKTQLAKDPNTPLPTITIIDEHGRRTLGHEETEAQMLAAPKEPPIGEWPETRDSSPGLTVATNILTGKPLDKIYIALIPTDDWTTIPAYMRFGDWNDCPSPEYHVAAMRHWRDRYGVELVGMAFDTLNLTVARPPSTREDAMALAREQYIYCSDIIEQGTQTFSGLAATLLGSDWWFFWWD
jgi:Domain of unknown function (DUF4253)